jgi:sulfite dehydrogenase (quinone) subunit SoeC
MRPPWSMIFFTTLAGAAQGLLLALVGLQLAAAADTPAALYQHGALLVLGLGAVALVAATFHLGRPERAWRAAAMWRTSWLSREVILLPIFLALVLGWGLLHRAQAPSLALGVAAAVFALALYVCTGMIYAAVKAIAQWAHPITPINYGVLGIASGLMLAAALTAAVGSSHTRPLAQLALGATLLGAATRGFALWRNLVGLVPKTTQQSALGIRHPRIEQLSRGEMGGSFGTREFFHGRTPAFARNMRWAAGLLAFGLPATALAAGASSFGALAALFVLQYAGLLAERWSFFAEGQHTQNLYQRR